MRGIGRHLQNPTVAGRNLVFATSPYSTSPFGRGRGRGSGPAVDPSQDAPRTTFSPLPPPPAPVTAPNNPIPPPASGFGHGQGRGKPLTPPPNSAPVRPSFVGSIGVNQSAGRGRGSGGASFVPRQPNPEQMRPSSPPLSQELSEQILAQLRSSSVEVSGKEKEELKQVKESSITEDSEVRPFSELKFTSIPSGGIGRGKVEKPSAPEAVSLGEVNRHVKVVKQQARDPNAPKLAPEEAVKKAMELLRKKSEAAGDVGRGRGRGRGMSLGRGRGRGRRDAEEDDAVEMNLGDDADGEKLARRLGPQKMNQLNEAFDEICDRVLPLPIDDAYEDALDTNHAIELEPEWHFGDLSSNPDIHDTPIIPLRDALEKMKPFIMAYENIRSQEEWEEMVEETMNKKLPIIQEIVDRYSGLDVITALRQQEELKRIADTLPKHSPASVKKFASNSILSLQSNPGWGFDKKMQFMDKLVMEVSQHYK